MSALVLQLCARRSPTAYRPELRGPWCHVSVVLRVVLLTASLAVRLPYNFLNPAGGVHGPGQQSDRWAVVRSPAIGVACVLNQRWGLVPAACPGRWSATCSVAILPHVLPPFAPAPCRPVGLWHVAVGGGDAVPAVRGLPARWADGLAWFTVCCLTLLLFGDGADLSSLWAVDGPYEGCQQGAGPVGCIGET